MIIYEQIPIIWQKIVKTGPVDPEIIRLQAIIKKEKRQKINASKIYSPPGKFAKRTKLDRRVDVTYLLIAEPC